MRNTKTGRLEHTTKITKENELRRQHQAAARSKQRSAGDQTAVFHESTQKALRRATEELAKERREREAVDKGDDKGQKRKRRKKGTIRVGYINADGTRDKTEVEMCKKAEAATRLYFIL